MRTPIRTSGRGPRKGIALIAVLIVVAVLALAAYRFSDLMQAEYQAADSYTRSVQANAAARGGVDYVSALLAAGPSGGNLTGSPYDNPGQFQDVLVQDGDQPRQRGRFSVISPLDPDTAASNQGGQGFRYGVTDEGGKININALFKLDPSGTILYNVLMQLPNMTDEIANSIIDWIDPDSTPRPNGAEDEYYSTLNPPYHAKNAPLDSIDELLYVKGVTPQLLYGNDTNRNGILDPEEDDGSGQLDLGWAPYLTVYSRELNVDSNGNPRIYVNNQDLQTLYNNLQTALGQDLANYIIAYRQYGGTSNSSGAGGQGGTAGASQGATGKTGAAGATQPAAGATKQPAAGATKQPATGAAMGGTTGDGDVDDKSGKAPVNSPSPAPKSATGGTGSKLSRNSLGNLQGGGQRGGSGQPQSISSLFQLVNSTVTVPGSNGQPGTSYPSPMSDPTSIKQYLPQVLDMLTTSKASELPARINVNTAPSAVLMALSPNGTPLLDQATVQSILTTRPSFDMTDPPDPIFQTTAWLITEANLTPQKMQSLEKYLTGRSQVYRFQSVGHFDAGGPSARVEAVIDTNAGRPRVIYYRDLTGLGKGFNLTVNNQ